MFTKRKDERRKSEAKCKVFLNHLSSFPTPVTLPSKKFIRMPLVQIEMIYERHYERKQKRREEGGGMHLLLLPSAGVFHVCMALTRTE
jgi:hypothetical protein